MFERSKIKLNVSVHAVNLHIVSKKRFSTHQLMVDQLDNVWKSGHRLQTTSRFSFTGSANMWRDTLPELSGATVATPAIPTPFFARSIVIEDRIIS
ncbi:hypothetical protein [Bradyrhizobium sp. CCBAU 53421]|uniref:hypothetical protein n=1 Tax=Bradyrhizobium sp. CCBAU 53421 TaxID=1325120 RepID=UPI00188CB312|nr:hypothetical protein [Bradyrhizobium sp. CCBAU 53421]QOZ36521.1 hypothetical protein XH92_37105 [Bradyrhizobium sp. CCBAU 53421]